MASDTDVPGPKRFGVRELRNDTAAVLEAMEQEGEVYITRYGEVVAKLVPFRLAADTRTPIRALLDRLSEIPSVDTGWQDEFLDLKQRDIAAQDDSSWG